MIETGLVTCLFENRPASVKEHRHKQTFTDCVVVISMGFLSSENFLDFHDAGFLKDSVSSRMSSCFSVGKLYFDRHGSIRVTHIIQLHCRRNAFECYRSQFNFRVAE